MLLCFVSKQKKLKKQKYNIDEFSSVYLMPVSPPFNNNHYLKSSRTILTLLQYFVDLCVREGGNGDRSRWLPVCARARRCRCSVVFRNHPRLDFPIGRERTELPSAERRVELSCVSAVVESFGWYSCHYRLSVRGVNSCLYQSTKILCVCVYLCVYIVLCL